MLSDMIVRSWIFICLLFAHLPSMAMTEAARSRPLVDGETIVLDDLPIQIHAVEARYNTFLPAVEDVIAKIWRLQVDTFGFVSPADFEQPLDIYLGSLGSNRGITVADDIQAAQTTSWVLLDPFKTGWEATLAHEFHHTIQFATKADAPLSLFEMNASYFEWLERRESISTLDVEAFVKNQWAYPFTDSISLLNLFENLARFEYGAVLFPIWSAHISQDRPFILKDLWNAYLEEGNWLNAIEIVFEQPAEDVVLDFQHALVQLQRADWGNDSVRIEQINFSPLTIAPPTALSFLSVFSKERAPMPYGCGIFRLLAHQQYAFEFTVEHQVATRFRLYDFSGEEPSPIPVNWTSSDESVRATIEIRTDNKDQMLALCDVPNDNIDSLAREERVTMTVKVAPRIEDFTRVVRDKDEEENSTDGGLISEPPPSCQQSDWMLDLGEKAGKLRGFFPIVFLLMFARRAYKSRKRRKMYSNASKK